MASTDIIFQAMDTIIFIVKWFWWAFILLWIIGAKIKWKPWVIEAIVIEKRGNNLIKTNDRVKAYKDSYTGLVGYKLQKSGDTIPIPEYDHLIHNNFKPTTIFDRIVHLIRGNAGTLFLFKYGTKQYKPIKIDDKEDAKLTYQTVKDKDGRDVVISMYQILDPRDKLGALDFEVVDWDNMNFMVQEQRATMERRKKKSEFWKEIAIPAIIIGATVIFCIVMIKFGYDFAVNVKGSNAPTTPQKAEPPKIPIISDVIPGQ